MQQSKPSIRLFRDFNHLARLFYSGSVFVAFDTETTGLHAESDNLIEIGAVKFDCKGNIGNPFDELIKPPIPIPPYITEITHINDCLVQNCRNVHEVVSDFLAYAQSAILIAHNAPFDVGFINAEMTSHRNTYIKNLVIDTLPLARWAYPSFITEAEKGQYKLQSLAKRFNVTVKNAHRADDDARVCMEIFKRIIQDTMPKQKGIEKIQMQSKQTEFNFM
ncbi:MAG: 3'-5' exonuclease [Treponema sp.]|nr:3'-5' exonuclease [Treponema sp.]